MSFFALTLYLFSVLLTNLFAILPEEIESHCISITLCILETPKQGFSQTVKTQMISSESTLFVKVKKNFRQKNTMGAQ